MAVNTLTYPQTSSRRWKDPVELVSNLPLVANEGDVRIVLDTGEAYFYDGNGWVLLSGGSGGMVVVTINDTNDGETLVSGNHYLANSSVAAFEVNLPAGGPGITIRITDAFETWATNNVTINPASGEQIAGYAVDESLVLDVSEGWVEFVWNGLQWALKTMFIAHN